MPEESGMITPDVMPISPEAIPSEDDPGDDVARRFRYQWTYAAIVCCMLLDETRSVLEVFCEHHEDVLIKHADGMFSGLQVKTRNSDQEVWKTNDDAVRNACARFSKLEARFPGQFRSFRFLTNHPLFGGKNGNDLRHVLECIRNVSCESDLIRPYSTFVNRVASEAGSTRDVAFAALSKTSASHDLPKLSDIKDRLVSTLIRLWPRAADFPYSSVERAASCLVMECGKASSLAHENVLPAYLPAMLDPEEIELNARIAGKRIDRVKLLRFLEVGLEKTALLDADPEELIEPRAGTKDILLRKLDAGGFSAVSCNSAMDLRNKADYLGIVWIKKHGRESGLQRYGHVRSLVLSDAARAFESTKSEEGDFGIKMLTELRSRFEERRREGNHQLYECSNEHLEGFAYSLTSQCQVRWSLKLPWEDE